MDRYTYLLLEESRDHIKALTGMQKLLYDQLHEVSALLKIGLNEVRDFSLTEAEQIARIEAYMWYEQRGGNTKEWFVNNGY